MMAITLNKDTVREIIRLLLNGHDHRGVVTDYIDKVFICSVLEFFGAVVDAKLRSQMISLDWYHQLFLNPKLDTKEIMLIAGLNSKTIRNKRGSARKEIVIEEALDHHSRFLELVESLTDSDINVKLTLTIKGVSVELDLNESIVVINALAVKRAAIRGGAWSSAGKQVEAPLMETLCRVFEVDSDYYTRALDDDDSLREVDFYLQPAGSEPAKCEVKLMGKGNPESADAVVARGSKVFVASTLSPKNKIQLDSLGVLWTQLQEPNGFLRFQDTLYSLGIPYSQLQTGPDYADLIEQAIHSTLKLGPQN